MLFNKAIQQAETTTDEMVVLKSTKNIMLEFMYYESILEMYTSKQLLKNNNYVSMGEFHENRSRTAIFFH